MLNFSFSGKKTDAAFTQFAATVMAMATKDFSAVRQHFAQARKGQMAGVRDLVPLALSIVSLAVVVGVGALILNEMENSTTDADASSVLTTGTGAMQDFADFFTLIVVIGVAAVVFVLLSVLRRTGQSAGAA